MIKILPRSIIAAIIFCSNFAFSGELVLGLHYGRTWTGHQSLRAPSGPGIFFQGPLVGRFTFKVTYNRADSRGNYFGYVRRGYIAPTEADIYQPISSNSGLRSLQTTFLVPIMVKKRFESHVGIVFAHSHLFEQREGLSTGIESQVDRDMNGLGGTLLIAYRSVAWPNLRLGLEATYQTLIQPEHVMDWDPTFEKNIVTRSMNLFISRSWPTDGVR